MLFSRQHEIDIHPLSRHNYCESALCFHWAIRNIRTSIAPFTILREPYDDLLTSLTSSFNIYNTDFLYIHK